MSRRKKRAAWGSLTETEPNVWRIRYWSCGPDGYKRRSKTIRGTRKDAERARAELMLEHSDDAPCPTVGEVWERWYLPTLQRRVGDGDMSESTMRRYVQVWTRTIDQRWSDVPCDGVRPLHVQQWLDGLSRTEADGALKVLRPLLDNAVRYGVIDANPFREKYLLPSRSTVNSRDRGIWTLAELGALWRDVACGQWWEGAFLLAAFGGLRTGEALGVRADCVTWRDGCAMVAVERQVSPRGITDRLKTPQSRRVVPITGAAGRRIAQLAATCDGWISGDGMGGPSTRRVLQFAWTSAAEHPFQNLRAAWQTWMRWQMRVPPWAIEYAMGHLEPSVTGQHYDRPQAEAVAEVVLDAYAKRPYDAGWDWAT